MYTKCFIRVIIAFIDAFTLTRVRTRGEGALLAITTVDYIDIMQASAATKAHKLTTPISIIITL